MGKLLRSEALLELDHLVELGEKMDGRKQADAENFMTRVHTFVHYLDLPIWVEVGGEKSSFAEKQIDWIIRDIPNRGLPPRPNPEKIMKIVGILKGLRSSLVSKTGS